MNKFIISVILCLISSTLFSQMEDRLGLNWGIQLGGYFANKTDAAFYNGKSTEQSNLNDILNVQYNYDIVSEFYNDDFELYEYPTMKYLPTFLIGGTLQYYTNKRFAIYSNVSITKIKAEGVFQIKLVNQTDLVTEEGKVESQEQRCNIDLGIHYILANKKTTVPYFDFGLSSSFLDVQKHTLEIGSLQSSFMYPNSDGSGNLYSVIGYGSQIGVGLQRPINDKMYLYIGGYIDMMNYGLTQKSFTAQKSLICKILF
jgi:hypothetical protein